MLTINGNACWSAPELSIRLKSKVLLQKIWYDTCTRGGACGTDDLYQ